MRRALLFCFLLITASLGGQTEQVILGSQTYTTASSTGVIFDDQGRGTFTNTWEFLIQGGTPSNWQANISGCMRGLTCSMLGSATYDGSHNPQSITQGGPYDFYVVTWSSSAWTNPKLTINRTGSRYARSPLIGGNATSATVGYAEATVSFNDGGQTYRLEIEMAQGPNLPLSIGSCQSFQVINEVAAPGVTGVTTGGGSLKEQPEERILSLRPDALMASTRSLRKPLRRRWTVGLIVMLAALTSAKS
jgi:hypothetical protein